MILPELLLQWSDEREEAWWKAVMVVFPTQYGCQNIKQSLIDFRKHKPDRLTLRTGVDKQDRFTEGTTRIQIVTYGMLWYWLVKCGQEGVERLLRQNSCFLLDEFSGSVEGRGRDDLKADPQVTEVARLLARAVAAKPEAHRLMMTGATLERSFLKRVLP